ncbi:MAG: glycosyltransferase family 2 protein [Magnetospirillum sp.]|nr:glycosyltransferase family 2 protein [Magnetospirillum sp.]
MADLVTVVIPTYNRAYCLPRALDSALTQSHAAVEVVVVDDGSTDGTAALLAGRYGGESRVRVLRQANAGVAAARNAGLAVSRGDYVAFLDSDDIWQPWKLELQLAALAAFPAAGMVWSDMEAIDPHGATVRPRYLHDYYCAYRWFPRPEDLFPERRTIAGPRGIGPVAGYGGDIFSPMVMGNLVHTSTALIRRQRLQAVGPFDERLAPCGEDYDFHLRTCRQGPVAFVDTATIRYQVGTEDRLTRKRRTMAENFLATLTRTVAQDGARIALPPSMIAAAFADAHRWIAEVSVAEGAGAAGRRHYVHSLRYRPRQPRVVAELALSLLPRAWSAAAREGWRQLRRRRSTDVADDVRPEQIGHR